ncbi:hypothetical protein V8V91_06825 [Algoriphagus halophilus]|uniref:hypothetical protein n=1 Tax=Algoriphagus halophilus TaxID=226505 RepID=UPI00358E3A66
MNSNAQEKAYFNQTELGFLYGKGSEQWDGRKEQRIDVSLITFHGIRLTKNHVIGFSTGLDQYEELSIIPLALGWRGFWGRRENPRYLLDWILEEDQPYWRKRRKTNGAKAGMKEAI